MRSILGIATAAVLAAAGAAAADVVVERWGVSGHVQHPGTLAFRSTPSKAEVMTFDLSALPKGAKVYRARLVIRREGMYAARFEIVPAAAAAASRPLKLVAPRYRCFDATDAVAAGKTTLDLLIRRAPTFQKDATFLEIAYEGRLKARPPQIGGLKAFHRAGQVFLTFREIEDISEGHDDYPWGKLIRKGRSYTPEMLVPKDDRREVRYRVYRHDRPITPATIGRAELLAEVVPGSRFNTRQVRRIWRGEQTPSTLDEKFIAVRLAVEHGKPLPAGVGKYVHTVRRGGRGERGYYAVVTAVNGVENTVDLTPANTTGPIDEKVAPPEPVLCKEVVLDTRKFQYVQRWYNWYVAAPLSALPMCYDVVVGFCPKRLAKPAPLYIHRGHSWILVPEPAAPGETDRIDLTHCSDWPNAFWMGVSDACHTLKGVERGTWQPFPQRRQEALIEWLGRTMGVDRGRIAVGVGAWGMMEFERPDVYAYLHGWGLPEVTKGFQAWQRAKGVWGGVAPYAARPAAEDPFRRQDYTTYLLENPTKETPFFDIHQGWGAHFTEMGWPPLPRFLRAMIDTKRPFIYKWRFRDGRPTIRRNQSLPAFGNCSLDDNPGNGDLNHGETFSAQINGYLNWDCETIVDTPGRWEMTVWLHGSAPLGECTVDLTARRCQQFKARPGQRFTFTNTLLSSQEHPGRTVQSGKVTADKWGLVTSKRLKVTTGRHRVVIER